MLRWRPIARMAEPSAEGDETFQPGSPWAVSARPKNATMLPFTPRPRNFNSLVSFSWAPYTHGLQWNVEGFFPLRNQPTKENSAS